MGIVYAARHIYLNRGVALKVLKQGNSQPAIDRFLREMTATGSVNHPNIVAASDCGIDNGQHFLVMRLIDGLDVSRLVRQVQSLSVANACKIVRQAAIGLQHIHELGMVHRDIKPGNLMLERSPHTPVHNEPSESGISNVESKPLVRILDLGLALLNDQSVNAASQLTETGQVMGTLDYMAPEQCLDSHNVDIRADIYGLGATLFKLLTGDVPYPDSEFDTFGRKFTAILDSSPAKISQIRGDIPDSLVEFIDSLLARDTNARPQTPMAVAETLAPFAKAHQLVALIADTTQEIEASESETNTDSAQRVGFDSSIVPMSPAELAALRGGSRLRKGTLAAIGVGLVGLTVAVIWAAGLLRNTAQPPDDSPSSARSTSIAQYERPQSPDVATVPFDAAAAVSSQEAWAQWLESEVVQTNSLGMELRLIPPGEFTMGDDNLTRATPAGDERIAPAHHVAITRPYLIAATEVTQSEYREVTGKDPSEFGDHDDWPVENIT